ncbi:type III secretion system inner rod subunit SctI [Pandoraea pnomenusa]|uniref:type III secretion system inner rod subunit SctI n=1 Tax=Pandoraea pnomenusa TaxID=93220 RepID=UPI00174B7EB7|nr:type III secretion system inner rod subunit SctI [Pandoraea pnomenusa]
MSPSIVSLPLQSPPSMPTDTTSAVLAAEPGADVSLESRFFDAVARLSADFEGERQGIADAVRRTDASDPASMIRLQTQIADYSLQVAMVSTLARKSVGAVEALLR